MKLELARAEVRMRAPFVSGTGSLDARELLLVRLVGADGAIGFGEAAPLPSYDGVALSDVTTAIEDCREALGATDGTDATERTALLAECRRRAVLPQAIAAIDLALWDLAGRRAGLPVWRLLAKSGGADLGRLLRAETAEPLTVTVNWTIAAPDRAGAAREAAAARSAEFGCVKIKVGSGDDAGRIAAVRAAAGPEMLIRLDANGVWSVPEAIRWLEVLEPAGIELCEEPASGLEAIEAVASAAGVPIAVDESAAAPGALERRRCQAICLKIARCGGITGLIEAAARARAVGYEIYLASTLDGPLGIAAALHAAVLLTPDRPCGLATLPLFADRRDPLPAQSGRIAVPAGPGLGAGLADWY